MILSLAANVLIKKKYCNYTCNEKTYAYRGAKKPRGNRRGNLVPERKMLDRDAAQPVKATRTTKKPSHKATESKNQTTKLTSPNDINSIPQVTTTIQNSNPTIIHDSTAASNSENDMKISSNIKTPITSTQSENDSQWRANIEKTLKDRTFIFSYFSISNLIYLFLYVFENQN